MPLSKKVISILAPENNPGFLLMAVHGLYQQMINKGLEQIELSYSEYVVVSGLYLLSFTHDVVTQKMVIGISKQDKSVVSNVFKQMVARGFVVREEYEGDTRLKTVKLTPLGEKIMGVAVKIVSDINVEFFSKNEECLAVFNNSMNDIFVKNDRRVAILTGGQ